MGLHLLYVTCRDTRTSKHSRIQYFIWWRLWWFNIFIYDANEYDATMTRLCNDKLRLFAPNLTPNLPLWIQILCDYNIQKVFVINLNFWWNRKLNISISHIISKQNIRCVFRGVWCDAVKLNIGLSIQNSYNITFVGSAINKIKPHCDV